MTRESIQAYCVNCDYCIFSDGVPSFCGEIDDGGCVSEALKTVKVCRKGHKDIPHEPLYECGNRLDTELGVMAILGISGDKYITQREGRWGKYNEPYPVEKLDTEYVDEMYSPVDTESKDLLDEELPSEYDIDMIELREAAARFYLWNKSCHHAVPWSIDKTGMGVPMEMAEFGAKWMRKRMNEQSIQCNLVDA